ncbi:hypothetical protein OB955_24405 [Halobacteria archaeon AArc-m2/3/4]|uniref:Uncharacterized protein n=1 Tax=Natronoglomus mannanivorans TaxID=2979990 RepID=A0ABT2QLT7_9EURY|nr:hypothetical protein [Halobacteria archaeon AArc-m2/3/4]
MGSSNSGEYSGIVDATNSVLSNDRYPGSGEILVDPPSESEIIRWTQALSGFQADVTVTSEDNTQLLKIARLYEQSEDNLSNYVAEIGVKSLSGCNPKSVLFMVCIRDLQQNLASKVNMNPHKFSVLRGGRYSVQGR